MSVLCNVSSCEYYEDGYCECDKLRIDHGGMCVSMRYVEDKDDE